MRGTPLLCALSGALCLAPAAPAAAQLAAREIELRVDMAAHAEAMAAQLQRWVDMNSGTWNRAGLERLAQELVTALEELGFVVELTEGATVELPGLEGARTGPIVLARREAARPGQGEPPRLLLSGHFDTVFEPDSPFQRFARDPARPARAGGPGVADMKGGLVVMLYALQALGESGDLDRAHWVVVLNADEEIGSLGSRPTIEREARAADYGFVFEAAQRGGGMVRSRRGLGQFHFEVEGVASHAGSAHQKGRSAVRELAHKTLAVEALTDYERGITLNVGIARGGSKRNIVPERAEAWIDLRYDEAAQGEEMRRTLLGIAERVWVEGTSTSFWGSLHRPPKLATPEVEALLTAHARAASDLGISLPDPLHAGGGTDGSLMGHVGLPTLDSMGVVGGGAHTSREFVVLDSLPERAALAAVLLSRLIRGDLGGEPASGVD